MSSNLIEFDRMSLKTEGAPGILAPQALIAVATNTAVSVEITPFKS